MNDPAARQSRSAHTLSVSLMTCSAVGLIATGTALRGALGLAKAVPPVRFLVGLAAQLFLSPQTVGHHLCKAYPKLGAASRGELADLALD